MEVEAPVDKIPMFAKAGAVIPTQQVLQFSDQTPVDPLTFKVFVADHVRYEYYEDDGHSFEYEKGAFAKRTILLIRKDGRTQLTIDAVIGSYRYPDRSLVFQLVGVDEKPAVMTLSGARLPAVSELDSVESGWRYDAERKCVWVKMRDVRGEIIAAFQ